MFIYFTLVVLVFYQYLIISDVILHMHYEIHVLKHNQNVVNNHRHIILQILFSIGILIMFAIFKVYFIIMCFYFLYINKFSCR